MKNFLKNPLIILINFILISFYSFTSLAQEQAEILEVKTFVEEMGNKIINIAKEKNTSEAKIREKIINEIDIVIDSEWIAKFVLGKNYKNLNDQQKKQFISLYRDFMINTYGPKFKNYNGKKFTVNEVVKQNNFYIAKAEFLPKDSDTAILTDFRVRKKDGKLYILDFIAEGISLIETQRSEFNATIDSQGIESFLKNLEEKVKKLKSNKK
jgi:phospholipid transport system substrate-binding protein